MRQSQLFGKTLREAPKDEIAINAKLLERGGFIYKTMAGVYDYLPLGYRVLEKINKIIREEMNAIGGQEILLSALQPKERWGKTGRWDAMKDMMYQFKDHSGREVGLAATHEEPLAEIALRSVNSYKDLPLFVYQIQTKFRDEPRAKSGLIRGREFLMKDLYSFHRDEKGLDRFYKTADAAYRKIFKRCGLDFYVTEASGGTFTKEFTHEYQVLSEAGEDWILYCPQCRFAQNKEVSQMKEGGQCLKCSSEVNPALDRKALNHAERITTDAATTLRQDRGAFKGGVKLGRSIEVGNIFKLGTKFSEAFGLYYSDEKGVKKAVVMGSYGIGPSRLLATIVEAHNDERGIIWPEAVAPFRVHLISLGKMAKKSAEKLYKDLLAKGVEVLYDDRDERSAGEKFADADLIGIPWRVIVSEKTIDKKGAEVKKRSEKEVKIVATSTLLKLLK